MSLSFKALNSLLILLLSTFLACQNESGEILGQGKLDPESSEYKAESEKIMATINGEFKAYFTKDYAEWENKYVQQDYFKYWGFWEGYPEKIRQYNSWEELDEDKKKRMAGETKAYWDENNVGMDMRDINLHIYKEVAWLTFKQISRDQKTGEYLGEALETKVLEKIDGEWKIAYLNFLYLPSEEVASE